MSDIGHLSQYVLECTVNAHCLKWFNDCMGQKINVSGPLLKEKALKFAKDLNKPVVSLNLY